MPIKSRYDIEAIRKIAKGMTAHEIAERFNMSRVYCRALLRKHGIKYERSSNTLHQRLSVIHDDVVDALKNESENSVAQKFKCSASGLRYYMEKTGIPFRGVLKPPVKQPNCWQKSDKNRLPARPLIIRKLNVSPLPEAGMCRFYDDNMELCTHSIEIGSYCKKHYDVCHIPTKRAKPPRLAKHAISNIKNSIWINSFFM